MSSISRLDLDEPITAQLSNDVGYYKSFGSSGLKGYSKKTVDERDPHLKNLKPHIQDAASSDSLQHSGAYIFRPSTSNERPTSTMNSTLCKLTLTRADGIVEVHQEFSSWSSQVIRLREGSPMVEFQWTVGPIPVDDNVGKEVISRFKSSLSTGPKGSNRVYTDANGREFMERVLNYRPTWDMEVYEPVAGNYYPITAAMYIRDEDAGMQLSILPDRAQSGASLSSGEMEFMVHRRLLADDNRGVGEPLDETTGGMSPLFDGQRSGDGITVTGTHYVLLSKVNSAMKELRVAMDEVFLPMTTLVGKVNVKDVTSGKDITVSKSLLGAELPVNVQLVSLERLSKTSLLVRLGHQFAVGEDDLLSKEVEISLSQLLAPFQPTSVEEYTLSANQLKEEQLAGKVQWKSAEESNTDIKREVLTKTLFTDADSVLVTLKAMEIRTFIVQTN